MENAQDPAVIIMQNVDSTNVDNYFEEEKKPSEKDSTPTNKKNKTAHHQKATTHNEPTASTKSTLVSMKLNLRSYKKLSLAKNAYTLKEQTQISYGELIEKLIDIGMEKLSPGAAKLMKTISESND